MARTSSTDRKIGWVYKADSRRFRAWRLRLMHWRPLRGVMRWLYMMRMIRLARHAEQRPRERRIPSIYTPASREDVDGLIIRGPSWTVGDFVPVGFEAYAWLPNPIWVAVPPGTDGAVSDPESSGKGRSWKPMKWSEAAAAHGVTMTKDTEMHEIWGPPDPKTGRPVDPGEVWYQSEGTLEPFIADMLLSILGREAGLADTCLVGQWEGGSEWYTDVKLLTPHWDYFVWRATFGDLAEWLRQPDSFDRSKDCPHVIWPADRKWCIATLYSGFSNYVAGSRTLIDAILASDLDAYETDLSAKAS